MSVSTADATATDLGPVLQTDAGNETQVAESTESTNQSSPGSGPNSNSPLAVPNVPDGAPGTGNGVSGSGDSSGGGLFSVEDRMDEVMSWFMATTAEESVKVYETLMEELSQLLYTLPAPGTPDDPMSWFFPENGWWPSAMEFYWMAGSVSVGFLILAGGASFIVDDPSMAKGYLRLSVLGIVAILSGPLFIGAYLHAMNALSLALAPSGQEFLQGPEKMVQLAVGSSLFFILLKVKVVLLIIGLIVLFGQFIFTFVFAANWPFSWAARATPIAGVNSLGVLIFNFFIYLPLLKVVQAGVMRFMYQLDWGAYNWIGGVLVLVGTIIAVFVVFILLPWKSADKLIAAAGVHLGMAAVKEKSEKAKDVTIKGASKVKQKWDNSVRGQASTNSSSQPRTQTRGTRASTSSSGPSISSGSVDRKETVRRRRRSINRSRMSPGDD